MPCLHHFEKKREADSHLWKQWGRYGFLFFFLKGTLWLLGPWVIYAFQ